MNIIVKLLRSKGKEKNLESNQEKKNHRILFQIKKAAEGHHSSLTIIKSSIIYEIMFS